MWCLCMSRLKNPTPCLLVVATCSAMLRARLIWLTEDGVVMMTRSAPCHPPMKVSRSCTPVGMPLILFPYAWRATPASGSGGDTSCSLDGSSPRSCRHLPPPPAHPHERRYLGRGCKPPSPLLYYIGRLREDWHDDYFQDYLMSSEHVHRVSRLSNKNPYETDASSPAGKCRHQASMYPFVAQACSTRS